MSAKSSKCDLDLQPCPLFIYLFTYVFIYSFILFIYVLAQFTFTYLFLYLFIYVLTQFTFTQWHFLYLYQANRLQLQYVDKQLLGNAMKTWGFDKYLIRNPNLCCLYMHSFIYVKPCAWWLAYCLASTHHSCLVT